MPKVQPLLDKAGRDEFAAFLTAAVDASALSKKEIARKALGSKSPAHLRKILSGDSFPTVDTVRLLSEALGLPVYLTLVRAGYLSEALLPIAALERLGKVLADQDGVSIDPDLGILDALPMNTDVMMGGRRLKPKTWLRSHNYHVEPVPGEGMSISELIVLPAPTKVAIDVAVLGFPRRGDVWAQNLTPDSAVQNAFERYRVWLELETKHGGRRKLIEDLVRERLDALGQKLVLPPLFRLAKSVLSAVGVDIEKRRAAAAEFVQAWVDNVVRNYASRVRGRFYVSIGTFGQTSAEDSIEWKKQRAWLEASGAWETTKTSAKRRKEPK